MDLLGLGSVITGAAQTALNVGSSIANYNLGKQNLDYQKAAQRKTWAREDTAVRRRRADLEAAGLNPVLAAGQAATTSSPVHTTAPEFKAPDVTPVKQGVADALSLMQQKANIAQTAAQTDLIKMQQFAAQTAVEKARQEILFNSQMNPLNVQRLEAERPIWSRKAWGELGNIQMKTGLMDAQQDKIQQDAFIRQFYFDHSTEWQRDKELLREKQLANERAAYDLERWRALLSFFS